MIVPIEKCTGCMACLNICPTEAIVVKEDDLGFEFPSLIQEKCISCKKCAQVCPILHVDQVLNEKIAEYGVFAGWEDGKLF